MKLLNKGMAEDLLKNVFDRKEWRLRLAIYTNIPKITEIFGKGL